MDSIFSFNPLWAQDECIADSNSAIGSIRSSALRICLEKNKGGEKTSHSLDGKIHFSIGILSLIQYVNHIVDRIVEFSAEEKIDPVLLVKETIALWYISAVPVATRDPHHGLPPDSEIETEADTTILRWNRQYAARKHEITNLGLIAMLLTAETWLRPENQSLRFAALVANATTTILFGAFMILPKINIGGSSTLLTSTFKENEAMRLYLKTTWQMTREGTSRYTDPPCAEFGTTTSEVKIDHTGRRLLSKIGQEYWAVASLWHPGRKTPGSAWNKFMKNTQQSYFTQTRTERALKYRLPSSCLSLAEPWEIYYSELRLKFDQVRFQKPLCVSS
uniref:MAT1-1-2 n=2 Tax=Cordyceps TaxID=45234 RepID=Q53TZ5_9HYPO|nr:MAT1-1-2 [Cordyceps tenuipes]BAD95879.1 MAT1-1-2 [Cordyceps takaomontana]